MSNATVTQVSKPKRWDVPFGEDMSASDVHDLLQLSPFKEMDASKFPSNCPLNELLLNDTRLLSCQPGDLIVREGDYGNSAFLVIRGDVRVSLEALPTEMLGRMPAKKKKSWWALFNDFLTPVTYPEVRTEINANNANHPDVESTRPLFLQDVPGVMSSYRTLQLGEGEFFGELAALSRTPRSATVFAESSCLLLEIRWQGLRDLMKFAPELKSHMDQLYRQNSLESHLRETPFFEHVSPEQLHQIAEQVEFVSLGQFDWFRDYQQNLTKLTEAERLAKEPVILAEGDYVDGLYLVRSGFVRVTQAYGESERTSSYLNKGHFYGLVELTHNWLEKKPLPWFKTLRAVGYVDLLFIPTTVVEKFILPTFSAKQLTRLQQESQQLLGSGKQLAGKVEGIVKDDLNSDLLDFLVDQRVINGTETMLIDLNRCTRCDDCVRACSETHQHNPRFIRSGPQYNNLMVAHACMHCLDPVCMIGCPTGAINRDHDLGTVLINDSTCIGCSTCANSCPYDNITMVEIRNAQGEFIRDSEKQQPIMKATKCDLCHDYKAGPACQNACPHDALVRVSTSKVQELQQWVGQHSSS